MKKKLSFILMLFIVLFLGVSCSNDNKKEESKTNKEIEVTDMVGRNVNVIPGSYSSVICIGAGALRMYSYVGDIDKHHYAG